jgi:hypothetical protein
MNADLKKASNVEMRRSRRKAEHRGHRGHGGKPWPRIYADEHGFEKSFKRRDAEVAEKS